MASHPKRAPPELEVTSQLGLFEILETEPRNQSTRHEGGRADGAMTARSPAKVRQLGQARGGQWALPRLCVKPDEAAEMLGVSRDYFDEHVKPELRIIRHGSRTVLIPSPSSYAGSSDTRLVRSERRTPGPGAGRRRTFGS